MLKWSQLGHYLSTLSGGEGGHEFSSLSGTFSTMIVSFFESSDIVSVQVLSGVSHRFGRVSIEVISDYDWTLFLLYLFFIVLTNNNNNSNNNMTKTKKKKMNPMHGAKIQLMYQVMNIRGKKLLDMWKQYPRSTVYEWAAKPFNGKPPEDQRKYNKGRPRKLTERDERNILRSLPRLRHSVGHFTSIDIQNESSLTHVNNRLVRNCLHKNKVHYLRSRKKGILSLKDHKKRLSYCNKARTMQLGEEFWTQHVSFYLDGKGFQHKMNPFESAKAPRAREWRTTKQGLDYGCVAKGSKEGTRNANFIVAMSYSKGVVLCEQYFGTITGPKFADIVKRCFPTAFANSINPRARRIIMDGCPRQNSAVARKAIAAVRGIIMPIPPRSPDLNPIENLFQQVDSVLKRQAIERKIERESFQEFSQRCKETLLNYDTEKIDTLIRSMVKRMKEVIKAKGQRINY